MKHTCTSCGIWFLNPESLKLHEELGCPDLSPRERREQRKPKRDVTEGDRIRLAKLVPDYVKVSWDGRAVTFQDMEFLGKRGSYSSAIYAEDLDRILPQFLDSCLHRREARDRMKKAMA